MSEQSRRKHICTLNLPDWMYELAESEAKVLTGGNVNKLMSMYIETLFIAQRPKKRRGK